MNRFNLLLMRKSQSKKVDNFQRNVCSSNLVFQNESNFSPREIYLPMKISCKFGKVSSKNVKVKNISMHGGIGSGVANTKLVNTINLKTEYFLT